MGPLSSLLQQIDLVVDLVLKCPSLSGYHLAMELQLPVDCDESPKPKHSNRAVTSVTRGDNGGSPHSHVRQASSGFVAPTAKASNR